MGGIKHATKKRFAKASTRKSTISKGISAEYVAYRAKLDKILTAIKSLIKQIIASTQVWSAVAKHQNNFANALLAALPTDGPVRAHAREVENTVRQLQGLILEDDGVNAPHRRIMAVLEAYLLEVEKVAKEYYAVEMTYTEVSRYQKKVDKLTKKGQKKQSILQRNIDKLTSARAEHETKLTSVLDQMKDVYDKHEAVFQCAHHAFWIAQEKHSRILNDNTRSIRWESMAVREHLVGIDVQAARQMPPIPRVQMLPPPKAEVTEYPTVEFGEKKVHDDVVPVPVPVPVVKTPVASGGEGKGEEAGKTGGNKAESGVLYIPDVPSDKPASPVVKAAVEGRQPMLVGS